MKKTQLYYYSNELEDEFSKAKIIPIKIDENYKYHKNKIWNVMAYLIQNIKHANKANICKIEI